ncbi:uncharacterized protein LOC112904150 isoform X2 [Agrilus planipennis]|uniref:Uncharacterized protein LOC112904150 isoform X2 n=1 Tax=Agrilus planipennis TaxID=224129 RepID=A0A7F5R2K7_AGRPL|nr:uncharacterized protein LOC112904150 isoform X2 [Agrilus planipennis]
MKWQLDKSVIGTNSGTTTRTVEPGDVIQWLTEHKWHLKFLNNWTCALYKLWMPCATKDSSYQSFATPG